MDLIEYENTNLDATKESIQLVHLNEINLFTEAELNLQSPRPMS